jgi:predicted transcriptional regulator
VTTELAWQAVSAGGDTEEPMFEAELELEKKSSSVVPLLLIIALAAVIVGSVGYWVVQSRRVLTPAEAGNFVADILKAQGPATLRFHTGTVKSSVNEKPRDPHYKLLEKAGLVKVSSGKGESFDIKLTDKGEKLLTALPEFQKTQEKDGSYAIRVPLAQRKPIEISKVTMNGPNVARIEYTWNWEPTPVGDLFDASGTALKSFNIWDTQTLIEKYGANFYHGSPSKTTVTLVRTDKDTWKVLTD